jgi:hypothetical protein
MDYTFEVLLYFLLGWAPLATMLLSALSSLFIFVGSLMAST